MAVSVYVFQTDDGVIVELNGGTGDHDGFVDMFGDNISSVAYIDTDTDTIVEYYPPENWETLTAEERASVDEHLLTNISNMWNRGIIDNLEFALRSQRITYSRGQNGVYDDRTHIQLF